MEWIVASALVYFIFVRHERDLGAARDEVLEWGATVLGFIQPKVAPLAEKARAYPGRTLLIVAAIAFLGYQAWMWAKPESVSLVPGPDNVYADNCGSEVRFGVPGTDADGKFWTPEMLKAAGVDWLIGPEDVGRELTIWDFDPFADPACARHVGKLNLSQD